MSNQPLSPAASASSSTRSIFRRLLASMLAFGLVVGLVFPAFVAFTTHAPAASTPQFRGMCVAAGLLVGLANFLLFDLVVSRNIRRVVDAMNHVHDRMRGGDSHQDVCVDGCQLEVTSNDALGKVQEAFNRMTLAVAGRMRVEMATSALLSGLSRSVEIDAVAKELLTAIASRCGARAAVLYDAANPSEGYLAASGFDATAALAKGICDEFGPVRRALDTGEVLELSLDTDGLTPLTMSTPLGSYCPSVVTIVPVLVDKHVVAVAVLATSRALLTAADREVLEALRTQAGPYLQNALLHKKLSEMAAIDELTKVLNRRFGMRRLTEEHANTLRHGTPLSALILDVDHFKRFNDTFGHDAGDEVLRAVGKVLEASIRAGDVACRYGGEEFLVIAPSTPVAGAAKLAERLRRKIEAAVVTWKGQSLSVTASIGVAGWPTVQAATPEEIVTKADEALYFAKKSGRNRVATHQGQDIAVHTEVSPAEPARSGG